MDERKTATARRDKKQPTAPIKRILLITAGIALALLALMFIIYAVKRTGATGYYEDTNNTEVAAFDMHLTYQLDCDGQPNCDADNPPYNFLVFVFDDTGRQVRIVRGDNDGRYKASLPEGNYTLLTSQTFQGIDGLPQEQVELQNGKVLKLDVNYGKAKNSKKGGEG